jgi:hypothetical protein
MVRRNETKLLRELRHIIGSPIWLRVEVGEDPHGPYETWEVFADIDGERFHLGKGSTLLTALMHAITSARRLSLVKGN